MSLSENIDKLKKIFTNQITLYILILFILICNYKLLRKIAKDYNLDYHEKTISEEFEDIVKIIIIFTLFWYISDGLFHKINIYFPYLFLLFVLIVSNIYGVIEHKLNFHSSLNSNNEISKSLLYMILTIAIIAFIFLILTYIFFIHNNYLENKSQISTFLIVLIISILLYFIAYLIQYFKNKNDFKEVEYQAHHWGIYFILSLLSAIVINTKNGKNTNVQTGIKIFGVILSGLSFGAMLHGITYYGTVLVLNDKTYSYNTLNWIDNSDSIAECRNVSYTKKEKCENDDFVLTVEDVLSIDKEFKHLTKCSSDTKLLPIDGDTNKNFCSTNVKCTGLTDIDFLKLTGSFANSSYTLCDEKRRKWIEIGGILSKKEDPDFLLKMSKKWQ